MAKCAFCGALIVFGGKPDADRRFCNAACQQRGAIMRMADSLPAEQLETYVGDVHAGACPRCAGPGPVDVHTSYRIWSALVVSRMSEHPVICCNVCGIKSKLGSLVYSTLLGWWSCPMGVVGTPTQIVRNIGGMYVRPNPARPSAKLENMLRLELAAKIYGARET